MKNMNNQDLSTEMKKGSTPLSKQVNLLGSLLGKAFRVQAGEELFQYVEQLRGLCKEAEVSGENNDRQKAIGIIEKLDNRQIKWLLHVFTVYFHLINKAEQIEITRINRERETKASAESPRSESIAEAIHSLRNQGYSFEQVMDIINRLDIQPTLTAHPTEARRQNILFKQRDIAHLLIELQNYTLTPSELDDLLTDLYQQIHLFLATDEVRSARVTVQDEIKQGLYFSGASIWNVIPAIYHDLKSALKTYYNQDTTLPIFLRYRSWIGGDRDGNPNVTSKVTETALALQRKTILNLYLQELSYLANELSISTNQLSAPQKLFDSIEKDKSLVKLDQQIEKVYRLEPFRIKVLLIVQKLEKLISNTHDVSESLDSIYKSEHLVQDLELLQDCLQVCGLEDLADNSRLEKLIIRAKTFGFYFTALDIRQHCDAHHKAVAECLSLAGVHFNYNELSEEKKIDLLSNELKNSRPLLPHDAVLSDETAELLNTLRAMRQASHRDPASIGGYIISMTHHVSDLLEVMLLAKEVGLWKSREQVESNLDLVPLFETIEDLAAADKFMAQLFENDIYRRHLQSRGNFQEIMLGYSDSSKDGGYWMANWALQQAQKNLGDICRKYDITFRLFHGRGGTVGRGGGRANMAILAMPESVHNGKIRFTEQGEVISFRYGLAALAHRHLEQIVNAMILSSTQKSKRNDFENKQVDAIMNSVAKDSMKKYRSLVYNPAFWPWYRKVTPIEHISRLPIASRPVSRKSSEEVDFQDLRAIPWVFAWTQTRYNVPGWFGIGSGLSSLMTQKEIQLNTLQQLYRNWIFFRTIIDNAQQEMARARLQISEYYHSLSNDEIHKVICDEFDLASEMILNITGQNELLDSRPVIKKSIFLRNPYTDVLNLLQVELLKRWRQNRQSDVDEMRQLLFLSINGIAAAMQSTG